MRVVKRLFYFLIFFHAAWRIVCIALTFAMCGVVVEAQQAGKIPRIGYLIVASLSASSARVEAFRQGLRELGYVEGKNIIIERRSAEGKLERIPAIVAELVRLKVDIIVTAGPSPTRAAKEATSTIPIVMAQDSDLLGAVSLPAWRDRAGTSLDCRPLPRS